MPSRDSVNVLGIWDGHDSGAALLADGRLRCAVNEERFTRRKLEVAFPVPLDRGVPGARRPRARTVDVVAVSTSDPAKTLGRWWPASKERYYAVRRRKARPGALAALTRGGQVPDDRVVARASLAAALSRIALRASSPGTGWRTPSCRLVDHHEAHAAAAAWASGFDAVRGAHDRRPRRRPVGDHLRIP